MSIGTTIKKLRRDNQMTQERLAELLGVSTNAVSQWECDKTAPDISHLPLLASIFEVSADVLLEIDLAKSKKQAELQVFTEKYAELRGLGKTEERVKLCRAMLEKYPNDELVRYYLMRALQNGYMDESFEEIVSLGEELLNSATTEYRMGAIRGLCYTYLHRQEYAMAQQYADMMPPAEDLHVHVLHGEALAEHCQRYFWKLADQAYLYLKYLLDCDGVRYTPEEKHIMWETLYRMCHMIFSNGDFGFLQERLAKICFFMAAESAACANFDTALDELEQMVTYVENCRKLSDVSHTSLLVNRIQVMANSLPKHSEESLAQAMLRYLTNRECLFAPIALDGRMADIRARLKACV